MASFNCYDIDGDILDMIYQWDTHRIVKVYDLAVWTDATVHFDFTNSDNMILFTVDPISEVIQSGNDEIVVYTAIIPDELLQIPKPIILHIYQTTAGNENKTIDSVRISVAPRIMPYDYTYTPTQKAVKIATGLERDGDTLYLKAGNERIGEGVVIDGGGGDTGYAIGDAAVVLDGAMRHTIGIAEFSPIEEE